MVLRDIPKLIDEPTSGLDYSSMVNVSELPKKLTLNKLALIGEAEKSP